MIINIWRLEKFGRLRTISWCVCKADFDEVQTDEKKVLTHATTVSQKEFWGGGTPPSAAVFAKFVGVCNLCDARHEEQAGKRKTEL